MSKKHQPGGMNRRQASSAIGIVATLVAGCWSNPPPGRVTATGTVSVAGQPLPDGDIEFDAVEDGIGGGVARIEPGGVFSLFLRPGTYRVGIVSVEGGVGPGGVAAADPAKIRVPVRYAKPESSGLEYTIDASNHRLAIDIPK